jgi:hypothetical protein
VAITITVRVTVYYNHSLVEEKDNLMTTTTKWKQAATLEEELSKLITPSA